MTTPEGRETVCACIIARDEEERLPGALESVAFCDELVVVDSGSHDRTAEIARAAGAKLVVHPFRTFGKQRNVAIDHATSNWILEVDADERITPRLRAEIEAFLAAVPAGVDICGVPCRDLLLGGPLGPSAKYPKYRLRLFRRGRYYHDETREGPRGPVGVRAHLGVRGRPRAPAGGDAGGGHPRRLALRRAGGRAAARADLGRGHASAASW